MGINKSNWYQRMAKLVLVAAGSALAAWGPVDDFEVSGDGSGLAPNTDDEEIFDNKDPKLETAIMGGSSGSWQCSTVFYENNEFFGCISWWWVLCVGLVLGTVFGCLIPRWHRQVKKRRRMSKRRKSTTSTSQWISTKAFFSCGKDQPEYLRGAPTTTYKSSHDISKLPDAVFESA